ncbi:MAG: precorrin-6y C5,15-methyltransferase (decarboxylating) subunit CbiE [Tissierellia bacterium]|nr:precorrin-6y C5,15-methyltransferase (decarboxylating) subunit CbiE [Tissierellia bacterium]
MLIVAGVGPGNPKYLTREVYELIIQEENIIAFGRVSRTLQDIRKDIVGISSVGEILEYIDKYENLLILASGDPLFYGITSYLKTKGYHPDKICPGISSFQYLSCKCQIPWNKARFFSLHGRDFNLKDLLEIPLAIGFIDKNHLPTQISKALYELGIRGYLIIGYDLSYEEEKIERIPIGESCSDITDLAVMVIENEVAQR